jgi:antitoxin ParD1/3/4
MRKVEKLSVDLTPRLDAVVKDAIASGQYASASDVVQEALMDWEDQKSLRHFSDEELRHLWNEGIASGTAKPFNTQDIVARAKNLEI